MHGKGRAILAFAFNLAAHADNALDACFLILLEIGIMLGGPGLRHQKLDVATNKFIHLISEQFHSRFVDGLNDGAAVNRDD